MVADTLDPLRCALFLIVAMSAAGFAHSAWLRSSLSRKFMHPIDGGRTWRGRRLLGDNKSWRGFMMIVPASAATFAGLRALVSPGADGLWTMAPLAYAALGALAGLGFMAGELPNSFVKRQLGIAPGESPASPTLAMVGLLIDRLDSILGMLVVVSLAVPTPWLTWGWVLVLGPFIHWGFSFLLYRLGVKRRHA